MTQRKTSKPAAARSGIRTGPKPVRDMAVRDSEPDPTGEQTERNAPWPGVFTTSAVTGLAFSLYWRTAAPDLTWAHHGADGGDLLAAAVANGVPHPSGYPLYTLLLQGWLWAGGVIAPESSPARLGNMFSAALGAATVAVAVIVAKRLLGRRRRSWWPAAAAGLLLAVSPLLWSQSLITEVYALHGLLAALFAATVLWPASPLWIGVSAALGLAHHLTFALLFPAAGYVLWRRYGRALLSWQWAGAAAVAALLAAAVYLRIPIAASARNGPPPVNWGYADNWSGFWWLVSGSAYRGYLGDVEAGSLVPRSAAWARSLAVQYTPAGLLIAAAGLASWDRARPTLRTFALLWMLPVSLYSIFYATRDAEVYLVPVVWLLAVLAAAGAEALAAWAATRSRASRSQWVAALGMALAVGAVVLVVVRAPQLDLQTDSEAVEWLSSVAQEISPNSIVVSGGDRPTFALWYGAFATGELLDQAPGSVFVNDALYEFEWYRRLLGDIYPDVPGIDQSLAELLRRNAEVRPIYIVESLDAAPDGSQEASGPVQRYAP